MAIILSLPFPTFAARTFDEKASKTRRIATSDEDILMLGDVLYDLEG